jgi:hypothetical protein
MGKSKSSEKATLYKLQFNDALQDDGNSLFDFSELCK